MSAALAEIFPVGEILADELEARGWTQVEFADVLGRPTQFVSEIISGKKEITRESATQIAAAFDTSPEMWLNMQDRYYLWRQTQDSHAQAKLSDVRRRARLNELAPIQLLQKRGILRGSTLDELEVEVQELFELASLDDEPTAKAAAKRANHGEEITPLQQAWVFCVRREARKQLPVAKYSPVKLKALAASLAQSVTTSADFAALPEMFAAAGVRLVYVEALPGAKIDGCAMYVGKHPVIGLSGRGKRLDKVFFALLHESAHLLRGHVDEYNLIVEDLEDKHGQESEQESEANDDGVAWIFPDGYPIIPHRISGPWVDETATQLGIARIVLIGQLQKRGRLDWRTTLAKNAPSVADVIPGWE